MTQTERHRHARKRRHTAITVAVIAAATACTTQQQQPVRAPVTAGDLTDHDVVRLRALDPTPAAKPSSKPKPRATRQPTPARISTAIHIAIPNVWLHLADCESGEWDRHRHPIWDSRRWDYNDGHYLGGFNFAPSTYTAHKPHGYPSRADLASPGQQYVVARRVLRDQGVRAWPICGPKVGLTLADVA